MSPQKWFFRRWWSDCRFQYQVWRTVIDWTVALYLIVPGLAILIDRYLSWWKEEPVWLRPLSPVFLVGMAFLLVWLGSLRLYVEPADQLFLLQRSEWMRRFLRTGLLFAWMKQALESLWIAVLLWPLLRYKMDLSFPAVAAWWMWIWQAKACVTLVKRRLAVMERPFLKRVWTVLFFLAAGIGFVAVGYGGGDNPAVWFTVAVMLFGCWMFLVRMRIRQRGTWLQDIGYEQTQRMKWVSFILGKSGTLNRPSYWVKKKPWLFPRSGRIFRQRTAAHVLAEAIIKSFLRNGQQLIQYGQLVGVCTAAIVASPFWLRWGLWLMFSLLLGFWVRSFWRGWCSHVLFHVWFPEGSIPKSGLVIAFSFLHLLGFLPLSVAVGIVSFKRLVGIVDDPRRLGGGAVSRPPVCRLGSVCRCVR
ncbi:ABC transporter permease [Polycladomyces sp. WAk]|uniref:ABC transporter permease n=1 Tax=Polycladomyces zharkentensis TaxID=2807616 RepID=A0ABS2WEY3_9BACL|nr:ABC transporter permease [Polycladomyces sp. WAk]MBN2907970.1 ABC transporter permease [Polycladomyces sp. WAk]